MDQTSTKNASIGTISTMSPSAPSIKTTRPSSTKSDYSIAIRAKRDKDCSDHEAYASDGIAFDC